MPIQKIPHLDHQISRKRYKSEYIMENYINQHVAVGVLPNITDYIFNISVLSLSSIKRMLFFFIHSHLPIHYSFPSYNKLFATLQGNMLFEINYNTQMNLKKFCQVYRHTTCAYDSVYIERYRVRLLHCHVVSFCYLVAIVVQHPQFQKNYFLDSSPSCFQDSINSLSAHQCSSAAIKDISPSRSLGG